MEQNEEMNTRDVKGTIKAWNRNIREREDTITGETIYQCGFLIENDWHNIPARDKAVLEKIMEDAPIGSEVEMFEWRKTGSKYWNYKPESFKVIKKGDGKKPFAGGGNYGYRAGKEEWLKEKSSIILQSLLSRAVEQNKDGTPEATIKIAEKFLQWHNDKLLGESAFLKQAFFGNETNNTPKKETAEEPEAIPMEDLDE